MSEYNLIWRKYGLRDTPYFHYPLSIDENQKMLDSFVGRKVERQELKQIIQTGGDVRFILFGEPGVGKTSLLNYVRYEASKSGFFTHSREIEINRPMEGNEFIILTISAIYDEINKKSIPIKDELKHKLSALYELTQYGELSHDIALTAQLNRQRLMDLFKEVVEEVTHPRFKGMIIHYDNIDNMENMVDFLDLISEVRDMLMNRKVIFFFVADKFLPMLLNLRPRMRIFHDPALEIKQLSLNDIIEIINERIKSLSISDTAIKPHKDECIKTLYELHNGNLREILNSLSNSVTSLPPSNTPIIIDNTILRDVLYKKAERLVSELTQVERDILNVMIDKDWITPTELSRITKKSIQNISSKYLNKFQLKNMVRLKNIEGRNKFYEVMPHIKWVKLRIPESQKEDLLKNQKDILKIRMQKNLKDFLV